LQVDFEGTPLTIGLPPRGHRHCAAKRRPARHGATETKSTLCQQAIHGVGKMSGRSKQPTAQSGVRRPASLVDSQLAHIENMVEYVSRESAADVLQAFDHEYWEKRIRALEETHELIASQRQRTARLLERLANEAQIGSKRRTAA
jgi:hypothetical protein